MLLEHGFARNYGSYGINTQHLKQFVLQQNDKFLFRPFELTNNIKRSKYDHQSQNADFEKYIFKRINKDFTSYQKKKKLLGFSKLFGIMIDGFCGHRTKNYDARRYICQTGESHDGMDFFGQTWETFMVYHIFSQKRQ